MDQDDVSLCDPDVRFRDAFLAMLDDYRAAGEDRHQDVRAQAEADFAAFVQARRQMCLLERVKPGLVPANEYWLLRGGRDLLGVVRLRHCLNESLNHEGGNIGYDIRPSARNRGYATRMLALTLEKARARGLPRVLVTCNKDNLASARVIQKNGGRLESEVISYGTGKVVQRYWIELQTMG